MSSSFSVSSRSAVPLGLGCVTFGREIDRSAAFALMDRAVEAGIDFFDTAAAYGGGASERIVGEWLADRRRPLGAPTVATKLLPPYTREHILDSVAESRTRLGRERLDVLFVHRWDATLLEPEALAALDAVVRDGQAATLAASNFTAEQLAAARRQQVQRGLAAFALVENNHNVAVRDVTPELRALCAAEGVGIVTYSPLGAGFLSGKHAQGVAPGSRFEVIPGHQRVYFHETAYRRLAALERVAAHTGYTPVQLALAWALHQPGIDRVLVGGRTPAHLEQALAAREIYEPGIFAELDRA